MEIQQCKVSPCTFPARIAPFSVPEPLPFSHVGLRKARFERETWTYLHCCISIMEEVKINDLQKSTVTGLLYVHIDFEAVWTFLQRATWILNPSGYCALQRRQGARVRHQSRFICSASRFCPEGQNLLRHRTKIIAEYFGSGRHFFPPIVLVRFEINFYFLVDKFAQYNIK